MSLFSRPSATHPHTPHVAVSWLLAAILFVVFLTGNDDEAGYKVALVLSVVAAVVGGTYWYKDFRANERNGPMIPIKPVAAEDDPDAIELLDRTGDRRNSQDGYEVLA